MSKKGQSISINTIIIAAIALAVLVVLFYIFTGRLSIFSKGVGETTNCLQACKSAGYNGGDVARSSSGTEGTFPVCDSSTTPLPGYSVIDNGMRKSCCCSNV